MSLHALHLANGRTSNTGVLRLMGRLLSGTGVLESTGFTVTAQGTPDMTVRVSGSTLSDNLVIITTTGDTYYGWNTTNANVSIGANATGVTKKDHIIAYVDTALATATPDNPAGLVLIAVRGTGTAAPTDGEINTATLSKPWIRLAEVSVSNGASSINSGNITNLRTISRIDLNVVEQINTTNTEKTVKILTGWGQIIGDDTADISETVTFGTAFASPPIVVASPLGFKNGAAATAIGDFATAGGSKTLMISPTSITTTNFSAYMTLAGTLTEGTQAFASSGYWGYSWQAIGETA